MRGSGWILALGALLLWLAAIGWPFIASIEVILSQPRSGIEIRQPMQLLLISSGWGLAIALGAMILGWLPGRLLGARMSRGSRGFLPLAVLLLVPICLPAYVIFFAWWQAWPADTWIYRWAVAHGQVQNVRHATLLIGFLCWSWPIVSWCVAGSVAARPAQRDELLRLDGAGFIRTWIDRLRTDFRGLAIGGLIVFLATFNNTVVFDLAEIFTFGNELRAIAALGASHRDVLSASLPATLLTMLGAAAIWMLLATDVRERKSALRTAPAGKFPGIYLAGLWIISVAFPLVLLARNLRVMAGQRTVAEQLREFTLFYGTGLTNMLAVALVTALLSAVIAVGLYAMWQDRRRWVRILAHTQAIGWIIAAAVPGTMVGIALTTAYNRPGVLENIYLHPAILVLGHAARFAFIGALLGYWLAMREARNLADLRAIDGAGTLGGIFRSSWPRLLAAGGAALAVVLVLSVGEIPVTAAVRPPGFDTITTSILNDMHFQRPQTVMFATGVFIALALIAAGVVSAVSLRLGLKPRMNTDEHG